MKHLGEFLKKSLLTGILVVVPVVGSAWLLIIFVGWIDGMALQVWSFMGIPQSWNPNKYLPIHLPIFGLLTAAMALIIVGTLARLYFINYFISLGERFIKQVPVLRSLYAAIKQLLLSISSRKEGRFRKVVLVEFPRKGLYSIGFITGKAVGELQDKTKETVYNVFLPTTPNPTSGFFIMVPENEFTELSISVEDAFKIIISGGMVTPESPKK